MNVLEFGDYGPDVLTLQRNLNRIGFPIKADGYFGNERTKEDETGDALAMFQGEHGLTVDRKYGPKSDAVMQRELAKLDGADVDHDISVKAFQLILDYEVGGGESYYNKCLRHPVWPGGASGVTIGVGFDIGHEVTMDPWRYRISAKDFDRLNAALGVKGERAKSLTRDVSDIVIPWEPALQVFEEYTIARELRKTHEAFPGLWRLPLDVQGALVSLVFNRGASMVGDRRLEMREIRDAVWVGDCQAIAAALIRMKRLWGKDMSGLWRRRDAEARLVLEAVA